MKKALLFLLFIVASAPSIFGQLFPNPSTLSTGQGTPGANDPLWTCSPWYSSPPSSPTGATFTPALINNNCAPGNWVSPASLPAPMNNSNWITGQDANCAQNTSAGYRFFRLQLNLPADCNGYSVTQPGNYTLTFNGYVDNQITDVFLNGTSLGISGGGYSAGSQLTFSIVGPWQVGVNYIDVLVYNTPDPSNPSNPNPYGLLLVADAASLNGSDTDNDGITDLFDQCPCDPGNNAVGCAEQIFTCDVDFIRTAFTGAGCQELQGCWDDCSMYFLNPQFLSGSQAQSFAQNLGANLISIQSASENSCILSELVRLGYGSSSVIWIGFNDETTEGQFVWYDQSPVVYSNWAPGEPNNSGGNEDCVQIYPGGGNPGTWNDLNCGGYNSMSIIEVNLCPITNVTPSITMCQGLDTVIQVTSTILGSSPYSYTWNNGANQTSQNVSPMQTTSYYVTTFDRYNCSVKDTIDIIVNLKPVADFSDDAACKSTPIVNFTNTSTITDNSALISNWDFGNGQTTTTSNPQNTFPNFGSQTATLVVTSTGGCKDTITKTLGVFAQPTADFTYNTSCSAQPQITLQNNSSSPDNSTLGSSWDFGNGQTSSTTSPTVTFSSPLGNNVTLIVSTPDNCKDTIIKVVDASVIPVADFSFIPNCIDEAIVITNTSSIADNTTLTSDWDFGNGQTSTQQNPSTSYSTSGNYPVTLVVTSVGGCKDTLVKNVTVYPFPNAPIITSNSPVACPGDAFSFSTNTISGATYSWVGPQNFTSTAKDNTLIASKDNIGDYSVFVTVNGCSSDTSSVTLKILGQILPLTEDLPNVFTPNGDGKNDYIDMNDYFTSCTPFKMTILNRWGNIVWEQESFGEAFKGKDLSGKELADGVYFYKLIYNKEVKQGFITIIK